jgi:hypothetical protein
LDRRLGGLQSRSGHSGEEKYSEPLPGLEPPIIQPIAQRYTTELSRSKEGALCLEALDHKLHDEMFAGFVVFRPSFKASYQADASLSTLQVFSCFESHYPTLFTAF